MNHSEEQDRLLETLLSETLGHQTPPDLTASILDRAFPNTAPLKTPWPWRTITRWALPIAALVAVALGLAMYLHSWSVHPYPDALATGPFLIPDGGPLRRGAEVLTRNDPATLTLGGYCQIDLAPQTRLEIQGTPHAEAVLLEAGDITCQVTHGIGAFDIRTELGTVSVRGTHFRTALLNDDSLTLNPFEGANPMFSRKLSVTVFTGVVVVSGVWGDFTLIGGQSKVFSQTALTTTTPPATTAAATQGALTQPNYVIKGDFALVVGLRKCNLTGDQVAKIQPILDAADKEQQKTLADRETTDLAIQLGDLRTSLKAAGKKPATDPKYIALQEKLAAATKAHQKEYELDEIKLRDAAIAQMLPILTEEQGRKLKLYAKRTALLHGTGSGVPADGFMPDMEEDELLAWAPGVNLTEDQHQKAIAALKPLVEKYKTELNTNFKNPFATLPENLRKNPASPETQKVLAEIAAKRHEATKPLIKAMREAAESVLTPEQKQTIADNRAKQADKSTQMWVDRAVAEIQKAGLTDAQKQKAADLAQATRAAMLKLDIEDQTGEPSTALFRKLQADLQALLTPDQIDKLKDAADAAN